MKLQTIKVSRTEAIDILARQKVTQLSLEDRDDLLYGFSIENWDDNPEWLKLERSLRQELETGEIEDPDSSRFDAALALTVRSDFYAATSDYLLRSLLLLGHDVETVVGSIPDMESCPCCGLKTIGRRGYDQICTVCWWHDDGQDNKDASIVRGGPNYELSLTYARMNYLRFGISNPSRTDLIDLQDPADMYARGRHFEIDFQNDILSEPKTDWKVHVDIPTADA